MKNAATIRKAVTVLVLLFTTTLMYAQSADSTATPFCQVNMTNGSKVNGQLISEDSANVMISNAALGQLTILKSNVETVQVVETGSTYSFTMSSGKVYRGLVIAQNNREITIKTGSGNVQLMNANITDLSSGVSEIVVTRADHGSRYLFAPSAIPLKKGEGYYHNVMIFVNGCHYGITDRWSVGGGVLFPVGMYGTVKYGQQIDDKVHVAAGGMFVTSFFGIGMGMGCGFGSVTLGDRYTNATFTIGYGGVSNNGEWDVTRRPILNFSGMARINDNFSLITENYLFPVQRTSYSGTGESLTSNEYYPQLSAGFRIGGGKHSFDVAAMTIGDMTEGDFYAIPFLGYAYRFTNSKF